MRTEKQKLNALAYYHNHKEFIKPMSPEKRKEASRRYYLKNKEAILEKNKKYKLLNKKVKVVHPRESNYKEHIKNLVRLDKKLVLEEKINQFRIKSAELELSQKLNKKIRIIKRPM